MRVAARTLAPWVGLVALGSLVLAGCSDDSAAYCDLVRRAGAVENWKPGEPAKVRDRLAELIEVAPTEIKPLWEEFAAGFEKLVESDIDLDEVNDTTTELHETAEQIDADTVKRCGG